MGRWNIFNLFGLDNFDQYTDDNSDNMRERRTSNSYERASSAAIIYQSELDYISRCILDYPEIETGGQLFGYWTATGTPVVMYVIGPGRYAKHRPTSFVQDQDYLQPIGRELHNRYRLQHIGEWHSHHQLGLARPSGGDLDTMQYGVGKPGFPRLLLCIGNCTATHTTVNPFNFHESAPNSYVEAVWDVVACSSPYRNIVDRELASLLIHPRTQVASHAEINTRESRRGRETPTVTHWLTEKVENVEMMKMFLKEVEYFSHNKPVRAQMLDSGEPIICFSDDEFQVKLPFGFPIKSPILYQIDYAGENNKLYKKVSGSDVWPEDDNILLLKFRAWLCNAMKLAYKQGEYSDETPRFNDEPTDDNKLN